MSEFEELQAQHRALISSQQTSRGLRDLSERITTHLNTEELELLCFSLGTLYDDLPGTSAQVKAVELIKWAERRGILGKLVAYLKKDKPDVPWPVSNEISIAKIEAYVGEVRLKSELIVSPEERDQLSANLRYWSGYIYEQTGQYPDTELRPVLPEYEEAYRQKQIPGWLLPATVFVVLVILVLFGSRVMLLPSPSPSNLTPIQTSTPQQGMDSDGDGLSDVREIELGTDPNNPDTDGDDLPDNIDPDPRQRPKPTPVVDMSTVTATPTPTPGLMLIPSLTPSLMPAPIFSDISVRLIEPQSSMQVLPRITIRGSYSNLRAGWSIHALLQPVSQGGKLFPVENFYIVPNNQPSSNWEFEAQLGSEDELKTVERYIIEIIVATSDIGRAYLEDAVDTGIDELPSEFIPFPELVAVTRNAYMQISEDRLLFSQRSFNTDSYDLVTTRLDGTDLVQLTNTPQINEYDASLSSIRQQVVFVRQEFMIGFRTYSLWTMASNGQNAVVLLNEPNVTYERPVWSPSGQYIAYSAKIPSSAYRQLFLFDTATSSHVLLENLPLSSGFPSWHPSGEFLVFSGFFTSGSNQSTQALFTLNIETLKVDLLYDNPDGEELHPDVSNEGKNVVFTFFSDPSPAGSRELRIYNMDDKTETAVTSFAVDLFPRWGPDSSMIYFESFRDPERNLAVWAISITDNSLQRISFPTGIIAGRPSAGFIDSFIPLNP